jgi:hypothetical protein
VRDTDGRRSCAQVFVFRKATANDDNDPIVRALRRAAGVTVVDLLTWNEGDSACNGSVNALFKMQVRPCAVCACAAAVALICVGFLATCSVPSS